MKQLLIIIIVIFILISIISCWYYPRQLSIPTGGTVLDSLSGSPLDSVKIKLEIFYLHTHRYYEKNEMIHKPLNPVLTYIFYTDENGKFFIPKKKKWTFVIMDAGPCPYTNALTFMKSGYKSHTVEIMDYNENKMNLDKIKEVNLIKK